MPEEKLEKADGSHSAMDNALDPEAAASYIADVTLGLRLLAERSGLGFLAQLLDMAATEAIDRSKR